MSPGMALVSDGLNGWKPSPDPAGAGAQDVAAGLGGDKWGSLPPAWRGLGEGMFSITCVGLGHMGGGRVTGRV